MHAVGVLGIWKVQCMGRMCVADRERAEEAHRQLEYKGGDSGQDAELGEFFAHGSLENGHAEDDGGDPRQTEPVHRDMPGQRARVPLAPALKPPWSMRPA